MLKIDNSDDRFSHDVSQFVLVNFTNTRVTEKIQFISIRLISYFYMISKCINYQMLNIRGVFQKYAERFNRMFAIAARLMIFHVKHAWYMLIKYR